MYDPRKTKTERTKTDLTGSPVPKPYPPALSYRKNSETRNQRGRRTDSIVSPRGPESDNVTGPASRTEGVVGRTEDRVRVE